MKINQQIVTLLENSGIAVEDGLSYLLPIYFNVRNKFIPTEISDKINSLNIFSVHEFSVEWNIPLFENEIVSNKPDKWDWVITEYVSLFAKFGKAKNKREAVSNMKKLFSENPDIRKDEVIGATNLYLNGQEDPRYVRLPHYFISKGVGSKRVQDMLDYIDLYREEQERFNSTEVVEDQTRRLR